MGIEVSAISNLFAGFRAADEDGNWYYLGIPHRYASIHEARSRFKQRGCVEDTAVRDDEGYSAWRDVGGMRKQVWPVWQPLQGVKVGDEIAVRFYWTRQHAFGSGEVNELVCMACLHEGDKMAREGVISPEEHHYNFAERHETVRADEEGTETICDLCTKPLWGV